MDGRVVRALSDLMKARPPPFSRFCAERYGLDPASCLFVDDNARQLPRCRGCRHARVSLYRRTPTRCVCTSKRWGDARRPAQPWHASVQPRTRHLRPTAPASGRLSRALIRCLRRRAPARCRNRTPLPSHPATRPQPPLGCIVHTYAIPHESIGYHEGAAASCDGTRSLGGCP